MVGKQTKKYQALQNYIEDQWMDLLVQPYGDTLTHFGVACPFIAPSVHRQHGFVFKEQFYWDSYFTVVGLLADSKAELALGMVNNLLELLKRFSYVPNSNNKLHTGRSQPPLLSTMVMSCYAQANDERWLESALRMVEQEYAHVWLGADREVYKGLSRYYHQDSSHRGAEDESGWDYTTRFDDRAMDFLPIDLNALLFKYESDIAALNEQLGHAAPDWYRRAELRKQHCDELLWDEQRGLFFDYDYQRKQRGTVASLASYVPLFTGMASVNQAARLVENLSLFETEYGLSTTQIDSHQHPGKQWAAPNGWAPLHFFVYQGLVRYGYQAEAERIATKWVATVDRLFQRDGTIYEKYNVIDPTKPPLSAVYPDQVGFAWTNAVCLFFIKNSSLASSDN